MAKERKIRRVKKSPADAGLMDWKEYIFPALMIVFIIGIPLGIVYWLNIYVFF